MSELCFAAVDYGGLIPTSDELQHIIGFVRKEERNQCALLHLEAALVQSEVGSKRSRPPASRVRLMGKALMLLGAKQARAAQDFVPQSISRLGGELLSLCRDVLTESHGRDYRSLRIFIFEEFATRNMRVGVFDTIAMNKSDPRLRINVFNTAGYSEDNGITLGLLSAKGHTRMLHRSPETTPSVAEDGKRISLITFATILELVGEIARVIIQSKNNYGPCLANCVRSVAKHLLLQSISIFLSARWMEVST